MCANFQQIRSERDMGGATVGTLGCRIFFPVRMRDKVLEASAAI